ncbi:MAG: sigma 54-interacting transcriptional regulator [Planctomycetes bacterium]|nr:sigma 54-interacting transcriptional regulator [Planctomycetota bacterium]
MASLFLLGLCASALQGEPAREAEVPPSPRPTVHAVWVAPERLVLDGDPSEWRPDAPSEVTVREASQLVSLGTPPTDLWFGADDASLELWLGWNRDDLLLGGTVWDEATDHNPERWYQGDSLELFLDLGTRRAQWGRENYQVMLAPNWAERPWGVYLHEGQGEVGPSDGGFGGVEVVAMRIDGGYRFEARLPWRNFADYRPEAGAKLGFNFALCDRDGRGRLETYATWTGETDIAFHADRRGTLELGAAPPSAGRAELAGETELLPNLRWIELGILALLYVVALWTRGLWSRPKARRAAAWVALFALLGAVGVSVFVRFADRRERAERRATLEAYWESFATLLGSGALGHPEPDELAQRVEALLAGKSIPPTRPSAFVSLAPDGAELAREERTLRRGIPYRPIVAPGAPDPLRGVTLEPGESRTFRVDPPLEVDAVELVARVSDARYVRGGSAQTSVLSLSFLRANEAVGTTREVRHRQDLHFEEDVHRDHPGLEPAYYRPGGRVGRVHADALLLDLGAPRAIDSIVVRHVGGERGYSVQLVALAVRAPLTSAAAPTGLRANAAGDWEWNSWVPAFASEVAATTSLASTGAELEITRTLALGGEPLAVVRLRDTRALSQASRWTWLPVFVAAGLAPFAVAFFAEWLSARRRIRNKLAIGFAISSAVPLLALTLLLEKSLEQEHAQYENERVSEELADAERALEDEEKELAREAERLLRVARVRWELSAEEPTSAEMLASDAWWGAGEPGLVRVLMRVGADGRWTRVGTGNGWQSLPASFQPSTGVWRPWGRTLVCGVAQTASGAEQPMLVLVAREPRLELADPQAHGREEREAPSLTVLGLGRDPAPRLTDLTPSRPNETRRGVFTPDGELALVLSAVRRERGVPVFGSWSLTELLFAAGLSAVFTALLFAGILTGHLVGPIERLDRAVRAGGGVNAAVEVEDEVGHLAGAVQSFAKEVAHRVRQLESLRNVQEDLAQHLDLEVAREAALTFAAREVGTDAVWIAWRGEPGEEPHVYGLGRRELAIAADAQWLKRALVCDQVQEFRDAKGLPGLAPSERTLFGVDAARVLALPLVAGGNPRGALLVAPATDREVDLTFLRAAAAQTAVALENARLYASAVTDAVTGFLFEPGFRQRLVEEIQRAEAAPPAGVRVFQVRFRDLPPVEATAAERIREASRRLRHAARGLAVFGRSGATDLLVALPWTSARPNVEALEARLVEQLTANPWPDGAAIANPLVSTAAWPDDGPSARFVLQVLAERLAEVQSAQPVASLEFLERNLPTDFVAGAPVMVELLDTVRRVAEQDVTVVIGGETGTGKDRVAELVHRWSPRADGPLVHIHCPSLSSALIEDELFGHEVGAFTGADSRRMGPFEYAAGGTVVLDEVAGLSPEGQVALLRLVETRQVLPLGSTRPIPLDVRLVATTSKDLSAEVQAGRFRGDLYFRLNVAQIALPPLRIRKQAIPELVDAALRRFNSAAPKPVTGVAPGVLDRFFEHDWPGNLRELFNVLSRGFILAQGGELGLEHVSLEAEADQGSTSPVVLNERQRSVLTDLPPGAHTTSASHAERHGTSSRTALRDLLDLVELGYLAKEGERRGTRFRRTAKAWTGSKVG